MTEPLEIQKFLEKPEDFPEYLHRTKDFQMGIEICNYVNKVSIAASVVKATILYAMKREWVPAEHEGEQFHDYIVRMTDWRADGLQRAQPQRRAELFGRFSAALGSLGARVAEVRGDWDERRRRAIAAIDDLLASR